MEKIYNLAFKITVDKIFKAVELARSLNMISTALKSP